MNTITPPSEPLSAESQLALQSAETQLIASQKALLESIRNTVLSGGITIAGLFSLVFADPDKHENVIQIINTLIWLGCLTTVGFGAILSSELDDTKKHRGIILRQLLSGKKHLRESN